MVPGAQGGSPPDPIPQNPAAACLRAGLCPLPVELYSSQFGCWGVFGGLSATCRALGGPCAGFPALGELCWCRRAMSLWLQVGSPHGQRGARVGGGPRGWQPPPPGCLQVLLLQPGAARGPCWGSRAALSPGGVPWGCRHPQHQEPPGEHRARLPRPSSASRAKQGGQKEPVTFTWDKGSEGSLAAHGAATVGTQLKWKRGKISQILLTRSAGR